ncbi:unnamed protein product [Paramecium primaurelia]|uniref:Uncharacterized protein n=1 Tax=Paramecium primaurelia TaxID=5886 RepID=A0A8S1QR38_PARPR|nr:unnamed protein product [Paramecium primaurelia]CAD8118645.1 unnamed protein product [Paramecium primaurelia]
MIFQKIYYLDIRKRTMFMAKVNSISCCFKFRTYLYIKPQNFSIQFTSSKFQILPELAEMKQSGIFFSNDASIISRFKFQKKSLRKVIIKIQIRNLQLQRKYRKLKDSLRFLQQNQIIL